MQNKIVGQGLAPAVKKTLSLLLSLIMLFSITAGIDLSAFAASGIDYQYEFLDNKTVEFTKYTGDDSEFKIPSSIAGCTVTSIGDNAFFSCESLKSVTIPDSIMSIGEQAFWGCENLTSVMIPNSVKSIGYWAFGYCENLTSVTIGNSVTSIGESAFWCCYGLKSVTIGNNVTSIGESAFWSCENLTSITLSNKLTKIADWMFYGCSSLDSISIPNSVTSIGEFAFRSCTSLTSITIPNSVTSIGKFAFCSCTSLTSITIPNSVTDIDGAVFSNCLSLANITIPNSVTRIGGIAFENCKSLKGITIPNSVTSIEEEAFTECNALEDVFYNGTIKEWNKINIADYNGNLIYATIHCSDGVICTHTWNNGKVTKKATCKATGVKTYTCTKCAETKTETIAKIAHTCKTVSTVKATTKKNGTVTKKCSVCGTSTKTTIYSPKTISLSKTSYVYNGKAQKPTVTVKDSKGKKIAASNYTISYQSGRKNVGTYKVTIKFKGNYSGTVTKTFTIKPKATTLSSVTAKSKGFTAKWKKLATQTTGYEIQYSTDKNFKKNNKTVIVSKNSTTSKSISKLTAKKKYYVRVRTYKTVKVNGKSTKIYSAWSKSKAVTTKN